MGFLKWLGGEGQFGNLPELAVIRNTLLRPGALDNFQRFFIPRLAFLRGDAESLKVFRNQPASNAKVETAAAQDVEHGKIFGLPKWILKGQ